MDCEIDVTETQQQIIHYPVTRKRTLRIVSGPGAGKTTTLVNKLAYLIGEEIVQPEKVLVLSMTNRAVDSIVSRLEELIGPLAEQVDVSTFHGLAHRELGKYDQRYAVAELVEDPGWRVLGQMSGINNKWKLQRLVEAMGSKRLATVQGVTPEQIKELDRILTSSKAMTHSDFMREFSKLLFYNKIALSYDVVVVDEFQDMYPQLWSLVESLAKDSHLVVAGDPCQSIYGFLGSNSTVQERLHGLHPVDSIEMVESFRSKAEIVRASEWVLGEDRAHSRALQTIDENDKPVLMMVDSHLDQYDFIASEIERLLQNGYSLGDIAVLTRTNKELDEMLKTLQRSKIDTLKLSSSPSWFTSLFHFIDYMRILNNPDASHFAIVCTLCLLPKVGPRTVKGLEMSANDQNLTLYRYLERYLKFLPAPISTYFKLIEELRQNLDRNDTREIMNALLALSDSLGLRKLLERSDPKHITEQVLDFNESLKMFAHLKPESSTVLHHFIQNYMDTLPISLVKDSVKVSTIHSSKGLEFPVVFMMGCRPQMVPSDSLSSEDKRVYYVGMTRARQLLYTTMVKDLKRPVDMASAGKFFQFKSPRLNGMTRGFHTMRRFIRLI